jgi:hypothetical protein
MLGLWLALLLLTGGVAAFVFFAEEVPFAEEYHRFNRVKKEAVAAGNAVVYSRHAVGHDGLPRRTLSRQQWKTLVELPPSAAPADLHVVFVHGFDVGLTQSVTEGSYLARLLRQWVDRKQGDRALEFSTFSWRSDFGPGERSTGVKAATAQSAALADYLRALAAPKGGGKAPRIVVLTHGLGAQLALEALQRGQAADGAPLLEALVMVQPAVRRIDVAKGTYEVITGDAVSSVDYTGQYFDVITKSARTVLATSSSADAVVGQFFANDLDMPEDVPESPKSYAALGYPYFSSTEAEVFPPNFRLIELSPGRYLDMVMPSHDALFDAGGRRALWSLWQRVLRQTAEK